jgi:hypothetical protein
MLDPTQMTVPGLEVQSSTGRVARSPDVPVPHSLKVGESSDAPYSRDDPAPRVTGGDDLTDGYGEGSGGGRTLGGGVDFFGSLGTERKRKDPNEGKPDPNKVSSVSERFRPAY